MTATTTSLTILDTGFIKSTNAGTQLTTANRANSGNPIVLSNARFVPSSSMNYDDSPTLGNTGNSEVNLGEPNNTKFTISYKIDMSDSTERALLYQLHRLAKTKGYKALFYNVDRTSDDTGSNSTRARDNQVITQMANSHYDSTEPQGDIDMDGYVWDNTAFADNKDLTDVYHVHAHIVDVQTPHLGSKKDIVIATLTGVITS